MKTESLESRRLDLAASASTSLPLQHGGTLFASPSRQKENFTRASLHTEICTPDVGTFADLAKFTSISKKRYASKNFFIFLPHMTKPKNRARTAIGIIQPRKLPFLRVPIAHRECVFCNIDPPIPTLIVMI